MFLRKILMVSFLAYAAPVFAKEQYFGLNIGRYVAYDDVDKEVRANYSEISFFSFTHYHDDRSEYSYALGTMRIMGEDCDTARVFASGDSYPFEDDIFVGIGAELMVPVQCDLSTTNPIILPFPKVSLGYRWFLSNIAIQAALSVGVTSGVSLGVAF